MLSLTGWMSRETRAEMSNWMRTVDRRIGIKRTERFSLRISKGRRWLPKFPTEQTRHHLRRTEAGAFGDIPKFAVRFLDFFQGALDSAVQNFLVNGASDVFHESIVQTGVPTSEPARRLVPVSGLDR